ncbi:hypothetical protein [uncultured Dokdonia sp.]|nr:hypothetical protein [uncultured Dokdonia sp.]
MKNNLKKDSVLESFKQYKLENQLRILGGRDEPHNPDCFEYVPD